jgi:pilus assembly protein CpaC
MALKTDLSFMISVFFILSICLSPLVAHAGSCSDFAQSGCRIDVELHKSFVKRTDEAITRASIADPRIADVDLITPRQVLIVSKEQVGTTSLTLWHGDERAEVYDIRVYVPQSLTEVVQSQVARLVPGAQIRVWPANNGVILDGEVESLEMLDRVLGVVRSYVNLSPENNLVIVRGSQQVQLDVKIAEVSRSGMKQMGLGFLNTGDWTIGVFPSGQVSGSASSVRTKIPATTTETVDAFGNVSRTTTAGGISQALSSIMEIGSPFSSAFQVALHAVDDDTLAVLSLLKGQGLSRILASPSLVAMSGQEAEFMVGGEYPYPVPADLGQVTIEYKRFGVMLRFTPTVVGKETITIRVEPEVSNLDFSFTVSSGGVAVPGLRTRRGSTTLQLKDGQTFAMAGLLSEETRTVVNKIPFLGDIPLLGSLFTSKEFQKNESELVIIVTPRLVRALNRNEVPKLPGEGEKDDPSDADFFLFNQVRSPEGAALPEPGSRSTAMEGFIGETGFSR